MDVFRMWKPLRHDIILPLCGITYGSGPVPAIVSPWMPDGSSSTYLDKNIGVGSAVAYTGLYDVEMISAPNAGKPLCLLTSSVGVPYSNSLSETYKFGLLADVVAGLQYLHSNGVAHTDLTGSNVLINSDGRALVADYGCLTTYSNLNGTSYIRSYVRWVVPELFDVPDTEDAPSSPKLESDIYSFGCIAYQVLSGQQPYYNIRSGHRVVVAILRGVKLKRPCR
ncbi:kinase-like domain-containing protein [Suillus subalutaceus]|uniref:kinase-like domain-containing protein n=1 Tax=Suillus subalutaceus TaxID=48586 RepID=UPI001B860B7E|nr:kinase-like domain-containing protein [Suillus subalutaceus]KAG1845703.1 kinase-like domain-containing protein [Suillus subalutaceus]